MSSSKFLYLLVFVISRVAFVSRKKTLFYQGRVINLQPLVQAREVQYHFYLGMDYTEGLVFFSGEGWQQNSSASPLLLRNSNNEFCLVLLLRR